jgi:hypothetical protein
VLQLCFYTEQLERLQGVAPEGMVVVLGTGEHDRLLYRDFDAYYRSSAGVSSRLRVPTARPTRIRRALCDV